MENSKLLSKASQLFYYEKDDYNQKLYWSCPKRRIDNYVHLIIQTNAGIFPHETKKVFYMGYPTDDPNVIEITGFMMLDVLEHFELSET